MSQTFSLVCHETGLRIWIGQGWGSMSSFYYGNEGIMQNLKEFLNFHKGKNLIFLCNDENDFVYDHKEWEDRNIIDEDEREDILHKEFQETVASEIEYG